MKILFLSVLIFSFNVHAQIETLEHRQYSAPFQIGGVTKKVPIEYFGKIFGNPIEIFSVGNGAVNLQNIALLRQGNWLPKNTPGLWYLKEIRFTCPPLRDPSDEKVKLYSPSQSEVETGSDLEYKVDFPCTIAPEEFKKKLQDISNLLQVPFSKKITNCDSKNPSPECTHMENIVKILYGDFSTGRSYYCEMEMNVGTTWDIPFTAMKNTKDHSNSFEDLNAKLNLLKKEYNYRNDLYIKESDRKYFLENARARNALKSELESWYKETFDFKQGILKLKNGTSFEEASKKVNDVCVPKLLSDSGGITSPTIEAINESKECANRHWKEKYGINDPNKGLDVFYKVKSDEKFLEDKEASTDAAEIVNNKPKDCVFDNEIIKIVCPDDHPRVED